MSGARMIVTPSEMAVTPSEVSEVRRSVWAATLQSAMSAAEPPIEASNPSAPEATVARPTVTRTASGLRRRLAMGTVWSRASPRPTMSSGSNPGSMPGRTAHILGMSRANTLITPRTVAIARSSVVWLSQRRRQPRRRSSARSIIREP